MIDYEREILRRKFRGLMTRMLNTMHGLIIKKSRAANSAFIVWESFDFEITPQHAGFDNMPHDNFPAFWTGKVFMYFAHGNTSSLFG